MTATAQQRAQRAATAIAALEEALTYADHPATRQALEEQRAALAAAEADLEAEAAERRANRDAGRLLVTAGHHRKPGGTYRLKGRA